MKSTLETKDRILMTARGLFHSSSYSDIGIKQICDVANVQKGSFYHFFPSKRDLALAVIDDMADEWAHGFVHEAFDQNLQPMERLDYLIDAAYYWQKAAKDIEGRMPGCLFGNLVLEVSTRDDILRAKLSAVFDKTKSRFESTLVEAVAEGAIAALDTDLTAQAMLSYLEGMILLAKSRNDPEVIQRLGPAIKCIRIELMN
ncbi:MAG: TetR/AcrR family transcriptional regulator [Gammaproteobacteria bacterium]|jgi:TetR/AcrR family transcriptional repressor of nem operon|nr:TetR/AcrR family transcriptional regulator [Gammaproteobacteria bacterium]MBT3723583.1 TetR/AcrR family transcriptional regulator [Gammaproteobacteria bacterium]MBT4192841.1 TetR/AcrR family transcriptional regulator [Gammaproteobacteria bacterium]MBT4452298.1 TetR/AcrR family transcriptional regulator [Gammaproteobacteria bacterium]MBT4859560.1 TetR/AcrR family transcriptional regulator [Gammaproteobacteria bacterium]